MTYTLITGATGGLGRSFAEVFARNRHNLILTARNSAALDELKAHITKTHDVDVVVFPSDLSQSDAPQKLFDFLTQSGYTVDNLVNNAGFGDCRELVEDSDRIYKNMINVNISALSDLSHLIGKQMKDNGFGHILNVASVAAFFPGTYMATYYASKAYVLSFSQAMHEELKPYGVSVTALCIGPTSTGFEKRANLENSNMFKLFNPKSPTNVAEYAYKSMQKSKPTAYYGIQAKTLNALSHISPLCLARKATIIINKSKI